MDSNYNSNYYKKYLKYREKYLNLKNQFGGAKCPECGKDEKDCTCKKLEHLGDYPISSITKFLQLDDLIRLAEISPSIKDDINADIGNILREVAKNEPDDEKKQIIYAFLKETESESDFILPEEYRINRNIDYLNLYPLLGGIVLRGRLINEIIKISLSNENMLNLLKDLVTVFNIKSLNDAPLILRIMRKVVVTPENAKYMIDILKHLSKNIYGSINIRNVKSQFIIDSFNFTDKQFLQMLKFISNVNSIDTYYALSRFIKSGVTDEQLIKNLSNPNWYM